MYLPSCYIIFPDILIVSYYPSDADGTPRVFETAALGVVPSPKFTDAIARGGLAPLPVACGVTRSLLSGVEPEVEGAFRARRLHSSFENTCAAKSIIDFSIRENWSG